MIPEFGGERREQVELKGAFRATRLTNQEEEASINMGCI
jgi:hypothetical protein